MPGQIKPETKDLFFPQEILNYDIPKLTPASDSAEPSETPLVISEEGDRQASQTQDQIQA